MLFRAATGARLLYQSKLFSPLSYNCSKLNIIKIINNSWNNWSFSDNINISTKRYYTNNKSVNDEYEQQKLIINNEHTQSLHKDIKSLFKTNSTELKQISSYYFDGTGKSIRPTIICNIAKAINIHLNKSEQLTQSQRNIALIAEMIHVASLIHDDVIDDSELRRNKKSVNYQWSCPKAVLAGDYILAIAASLLAKIGNNQVVEIISNILEDLVQGELMQFGSKESENERFSHYLMKTYRKTASLIANSCKAVALLSDNSNTNNNDAIASNPYVNYSYEFGKNVGIAFQLIDDLLDFTSTAEELGKPGAGSDLKLGLATAPVLFAASEYPELNAMIMRHFSHKDDAHKAFEYVIKSDGISQTKHLAKKYCDNAIISLNKINNNNSNNHAIEYLIYLTNSIINRQK